MILIQKKSRKAAMEQRRKENNWNFIYANGIGLCI